MPKRVEYLDDYFWFLRENFLFLSKNKKAIEQLKYDLCFSLREEISFNFFFDVFEYNVEEIFLGSNEVLAKLHSYDKLYSLSSNMVA